MRRTLLSVALALAAAPGLADPEAMQGIIDDQIAAFRADDFAAAFGYAAPGIQGMFRTPDNFGLMVRQGYPMVWRPSRVEYLEARPEGPGWRQEVLVTDAEGRLHKLAYSMVETETGWRIAGVRILSVPEVGA
jgi:hypothetical protein